MGWKWLKTLREGVKPRELWLDHWRTALLKSVKKEAIKKRKKTIRATKKTESGKRVASSKC